MSDIIIYQPWGGLGDNLAHSVIPELCNQKGIKCYLSQHNHCRNQQIYDLIWGCNPYIEKEKKDSKDLSWLDRCKIYENKGLNHVQVVQKTYGFSGEFEYPKIYYKPKLLPEYKDTTFIDFNSISVGYDKNVLKDKLRIILTRNHIFKDIINVVHSNVENTSYISDVPITSLDINDLFLYCDIIHSAKNIITLNSGITNLSSTIKNQYNSDVTIYTLTYKKYLKECGSNGYFYSNNRYIVVD